MKGLYKDDKFLTNLDSLKYLGDRNQLLLSFIDGCSNLFYQKQTNATTLYAVAVTVEMIYFLRNFNLVLPHCFLINLIQSFVSGSKTVSTLNGKVTPSCGYTTYKKWLDVQGKDEVKCPEGDIITYYDNIGKYIIKNYRVLSSKAPVADIITVTLNIILNQKRKSIQKNSEIKDFLKDKLPIEERQRKMKEDVLNATNQYREYRNKYIENILSLALHENDDVNKKIDIMKKKRRCTNENCRCLYSNLKRKCDSCSSKVTIETNKEQRFATSENWHEEKHFEVGETVNLNKPIMHVGEPIMYNPNSYASIERILNELKDDLQIGKSRQWTFIGCDGPPYRIASHLRDTKERHEWAVLVPGLGHLHMNQMKTLFKVLDKVLLEPLGKEVLHFESPKAYNFFLNAKDTHKTFQALEILLHGTTMEFCHLYIDKHTSPVNPPSVSGFIAWLANNENESFNLE